ncbi:MAG: calcium-translocating P-type ATPase, PMCA-type, partial [Eubacteriaceae bacterium]
PKSVWKKIWDASTEPMILMLLGAAAITLIVNMIRLYTGTQTEFIECAGIFAAIFLSVGVTVIMEGKSEEAFKALNKINEDIRIKVIRDGCITEISQEDLVVGDIVELAVGDSIPADIRILSSSGLRTDESALTGESDTVKKDAETVCTNSKTPVAERSNMLYSGCFVTDGTARGIVTAVGEDTEFGLIAKELREFSDDTTPLQEKMDRLGKFITILGVAAAAVVFTIELIIFGIEGTLNLNTVSDAFVTSIVLIVAAVPEGLPTIVAVSLSLNIIKMAKQNALVRKLIACETIGSVSVICSDKTGTLTQNKMKLTELYEASSPVLQSREFRLRSKPVIDNITVNTTADLDNSGDDLTVIGNPTEGALLIAARNSGIDYLDCRGNADVVRVWPFSSETKNMTTVVSEDGQNIAYSKGSPEKILSQCSLSDKERDEIEDNMLVLQSKARRVLAFAHKDLPGNFAGLPASEQRTDAETSMIFDGFAGISDPLRDDVPEAFDHCKTAGIDLKMLTGDNIYTARAIGDEIGMTDPESLILNASDIDEMDDAELAEKLPDIRIVARSTPTVKMRIVKMLKKSGEVVAVTGDGINDAPAIKNADCGIAMGITGTEVSKEASDIVLLDDSFSTIITAVQWGRGIYENFQRFIQFQLTVNLSSVLTVLACLLSGLAAPFTALQLLWINIIMDGPPALTLGLEPVRGEVLNRAPVSRDSNIVTRQMMTRISLVGLYISVIFMLQAWFNFLQVPSYEEASVLFTMFVVMHLFNALNCRELSPSTIFTNFSSNRLMLGVFGATFLLQVIITQWGGTLYRTVPLSLQTWGLIILLGLSVVAVAELARWIIRTAGRKHSVQEKQQ